MSGDYPWRVGDDRCFAIVLLGSGVRLILVAATIRYRRGRPTVVISQHPSVAVLAWGNRLLPVRGDVTPPDMR